MAGNKYITWFSLLVYVMASAGCTGTKTFTASARPGETIAIAAGWNQDITRNDLTVTITPQSGPRVTYSPGDPRIRTIVQGYVDPVSKLVVSDRANVIFPNAGLPSYDGSGSPPTYNQLAPNVTSLVRYQAGNSNNWFLTSVFIDLPTSLSPGVATVELTSPAMELTPPPTTVEVLSVEAGRSNTFQMSDFAGLGAMIRAAERAPNFRVTFSGPADTIPHSIQIIFDRTLSASGSPWVTHGRPDIVNISWSDDGSFLKVLLTPVTGNTTKLLSDFDFYVTGAVTSLRVNSVHAYDVNGTLLPGFNASQKYFNN